MDMVFSGPGFTVEPIAAADLPATLAVYRQCEDFLALGPVAKASMEMVRADIEHSRQDGGCYCGIWNKAGDQLGVLDFIPESALRTAFLSLLMIALPHRGQGLGQAVLAGLEAHLKNVHRTRLIRSGVQVNNGSGIRFWRKQGFRIGRKAERLDDGTTVHSMSKKIG